MITINSFSHLKEKLSLSEKSFLLLYKADNEQSMCAYSNLEKASENTSSINLFVADVASVRDIHTNFEITTVPALLIFDKASLTGVIKGCHDSDYYKAMADGEINKSNANATDGKAEKRVTVYSTPTCSWCNTLKSWLNKNSIKYRDIDISADQRAADELVKRSGQQGVPQTDINGRIVVGFDQQKLKELLEIR